MSPAQTRLRYLSRPASRANCATDRANRNRSARQEYEAAGDFAAVRESRLTGTGLSRELTLRQNQIVAMLKIGSSNKEIAQVLGLSEGTIKVHLHRIYQRVGVSNRTQLAARSFSAE